MVVMVGLRFRRRAVDNCLLTTVRQPAASPACGGQEATRCRTRSTMRRWTGRSGRAGSAGRRRRGTRRAARSGTIRGPTPAKASGGGDGLGQTADDGVVLQGDDEPVGVEPARTDRVASSGLIVGHVQHGDVDVVGLEPRGGLQRAHRHQAGGDEDDVAAGAQLGGLAELEGVVVLVEHGGHRAAQQPQVGRAVGGGELRDGLFDVDGVAGVDDGQVRAAAQDRQVLGGLVAGPVPGGQARAAPPTTLTLRLGSAMSRQRKS